jgi:hypothetical protein
MQESRSPRRHEGTKRDLSSGVTRRALRAGRGNKGEEQRSVATASRGEPIEHLLFTHVKTFIGLHIYSYVKG